MAKIIFLLLLLPLCASAQHDMTESKNQFTIGSGFSIATERQQIQEVVSIFDSAGHIIATDGYRDKSVMASTLVWDVKFGYRFNKLHIQADSKKMIAGGYYLSLRIGYAIPLTETISFTPLAGACINHFNYDIGAKLNFKHFYIQYGQLGKKYMAGLGFAGDLFEL